MSKVNGAAAVHEAAMKDGLPRKAFAYAPSTDPATWKLPYANADGTPDPDLLPKAAAALSEGGFRGQKAEIPAKNLAAVKSKLRAAYRRWKGSDAEYPDSIKEATIREASAEYGDGIEVREATLLLDKGSVPASVAFLPNGDAVVIPSYTGDFYWGAMPYTASDDNGWQSVFNAQDAADMIGKLLALKNREEGETAQVATLDAAIAALQRYMKSEGDEVGSGNVTEAAAELERIGLTAVLEEAGKRNNSGDQKLIQSAHDLTVKLGAACGAVAESVAVEESAAPAEVHFAEAAAAGAGNEAVATLREAGAVFDDATRTVTITPIRPGFGNARDGFFYPADTLKEAVASGKFNGLKMFADHPRRSDEKELPERSVKDWVATSREASWDEEHQVPRVQLKVHKAEVWEQWKDAPEQVAFSVLGGGLARPGRVNGREARVVESFSKLRSVDWVTEAGAGGAIAVAESAAEEFDMTDIENLTPDQIKSGYPALWGQLKEAAIKEDAEGAAPEGAAPTATTGAAPTATSGEAAASDAGKAPEAASGTSPEAGTEGTAPEINTSTDGTAEKAEPEAETKESGDLAQRVQVLEARLERPDRIKQGQAAVEAVLAESTLAKGPKDVIRARFAEAGWGNGFVYTDEPALKADVKGELTMAAQLLGHKEKASSVTGLGAAGETPGADDVREAALGDIQALWGEETIPKAGGEAADEGKVEEAAASGFSEAGARALAELQERAGS